jgi:hypothetical protein
MPCPRLTAEEDAQLTTALAGGTPDNQLPSVTQVASPDPGRMASLGATAPFVSTPAGRHAAVESVLADVSKNSTESHVASSSTSVVSAPAGIQQAQQPATPASSDRSENLPAYTSQLGEETGDSFIINSYNLCPSHLAYSAGPHYVVINGVMAGYFANGEYHELRM